MASFHELALNRINSYFRGKPILVNFNGSFGIAPGLSDCLSLRLEIDSFWIVAHANVQNEFLASYI